MTAGTDGRYTLGASGLRAPLLVRATATLSGEAVEHVAVVPTLAANGANTANVPPLTTAVAALVAPNGDASALVTPATPLRGGCPSARRRARSRTSRTRRGRIDHEPAAYGDTSATAWRLASVAEGTALSTRTQNVGTNPNPRCSDPRVPALTDTASDYREVGLSVRSADRQVRQAIWFFDNRDRSRRRQGAPRGALLTRCRSAGR